MAPKLTEQHISPPQVYGKMRVRLASQVQSRSVAVGLQTYASTGLLSDEVLPTSSYWQMMNDIFDLINSSTKENSYPFKTALLPGSPLMDFIPKAIQWIKLLKIKDKKGKIINNNFKWLSGLIMALTSIKILVERLCRKEGFQYLLTR